MLQLLTDLSHCNNVVLPIKPMYRIILVHFICGCLHAENVSSLCKVYAENLSRLQEAFRANSLRSKIMSTECTCRYDLVQYAQLYLSYLILICFTL